MDSVFGATQLASDRFIGGHILRVRAIGLLLRPAVIPRRAPFTTTRVYGVTVASLPRGEDHIYIKNIGMFRSKGMKCNSRDPLYLVCLLG
jgi:hypothetical protein